MVINEDSGTCLSPSSVTTMLVKKDLNRRPVGVISIPTGYRIAQGSEQPLQVYEPSAMVQKIRAAADGPLKGTRTMTDKHRAHVQRMTKSLLQSITNHQRKIMFNQAQTTFDHKIEALHDIEVKEGIVTSLCIQLGYILSKGEGNIQEIVTIFSLLALVYQCSDKEKTRSFAENGEEIFRLITYAFDNVKDTAYFDWCTYHMMRVMRCLSRTKIASLAMVGEEEMLNVIRVIILDSESNLGAKLDAVATLKNITYYAENDRLKILHHPGLMDALIRLCTVHGDEMGKEFASAVIRNLAMAPNTKIPMVEHSCLLDVLVELTDDPDLKTRRNAISAIGSLAIADENSLAFVTHGEGIILQIMQKLVENEDDSIIRRRAARALRCFGRKETVEMIVDCRNIVDSLCKVAMEDKSIEAQIEAIEALACYISHAHEMKPYYTKMLDAMVNIANSSPPPSCIETLIKTLNTLSCFERHRKPMTDHPDLIATISKLTKSQKSSVICLEQASSAFFNLSCDEEACKTMSNADLLRLLVTIGSNDMEGGSLSKSYAIRAIVNLGSAQSNRTSMAQEEGLLKCLIQFASVSEDSATKDEVKATIIKLIPAL